MRRHALGFLALAFAWPALAAAQGDSVTFVIDLRDQIAAKTFDPLRDKVGVRGGVVPLSWDRTALAEDPGRTGRYSATVVFAKRPFGGQAVPYKFKIEAQSPPSPNYGWEEGRNRRLEIIGGPQTVTRKFGEPPPPIVAAHAGKIRTHPAFPSRYLAPRDVFVYLPPGYDSERDRRYPLLYLHDGQNAFDALSAGMEWQVDETAEALIRARAIAPLIVVAIANTDKRSDEYTPTHVERTRDDGTVFRGGGKADLYGKLLVEELKPFIDRTYRTRTDAASTGLGGASHGGLATLAVGLRYPDVFGALFVLSPSVWWDHEVILKTIATLPAKTAQRVWIDVGGAEERDTIESTRHLRDALAAKGWKLGADLDYREAKEAQHDEIAWAEQVEPMLRFFVPAPATPRRGPSP